MFLPNRAPCRQRQSNARLTVMRSLSKRLTKNVLARMGYELRRTPQPEITSTQEFGIDPMQDMLRLTHLSGLSSRPVVFDIGANVGDTVREFSFVFGNPLIHAFEPSPKTFQMLKANTSYIPAITLNNVGLGSSRNELSFHESVKAGDEFLSCSRPKIVGLSRTPCRSCPFAQSMIIAWNIQLIRLMS